MCVQNSVPMHPFLPVLVGNFCIMLLSSFLSFRSVFVIVCAYARVHLYMSMCTFGCRNFDIDMLNTIPCIWPDAVGYYHIWVSTFFMPIIFTACQLVLYGVVVRMQKLRRKPYCRSKRSCARKLCCCCPSTTYDLLQFRHRLVEVRKRNYHLHEI